MTTPDIADPVHVAWGKLVTDEDRFAKINHHIATGHPVPGTWVSWLLTNKARTTPDIAGLCEELFLTSTMPGSLARRAADTLERQDAEIKRLREALKPFAKAAVLFDAGDYVNHDACIYRPAAGDEYSLSSGHLLAARAALTGED
jgi:hypothetical protein